MILVNDLEPNNLKHLNFLRYGYSILLLVKIYDLMLYYQKVQAVKQCARTCNGLNMTML